MNDKVSKALELRSKRTLNQTKIYLNPDSKSNDVYGPPRAQKDVAKELETELKNLKKESAIIFDGNWHSQKEINAYKQNVESVKQQAENFYQKIFDEHRVDFATFQKTGETHSNEAFDYLDSIKNEIDMLGEESRNAKKVGLDFENYSSGVEYVAYTEWYKKSYSEIKARITEIDETKGGTEEEKKKRAEEKKYLNNIINARSQTDYEFAAGTVKENNARIAEIDEEIEIFGTYENAIKEIEKIIIMSPMSTSVRKAANSNYYVTDNGTLFYYSMNDKQKDLDALRNKIKDEKIKRGLSQVNIDALEKEKADISARNAELKANIAVWDEEKKYSSKKDFEKNSKYKGDPDKKDGLELDESDFINNQDKYTIDEFVSYAISTEGFSGNGLSEDEWREKFTKYTKMTKNEIAVFNYIYNTKGYFDALDYLESLDIRLNARIKDIYAEKAKESVGSALWFSANAGVDSFFQGLKNLVNFSDEYIPPTAMQLASQDVAEYMDDKGAKINWFGEEKSIGRITYDAVNTTANMVPSILTSTAVGMVNPTAGAALGAGLMGTSAAGNAYAQALNSGMEKGQARVYSTLVGVSEAGLQYALGGIGKLGGSKSVSSFLKTTVGKVENGLLSFSLNFGGSVIAEGVEEGLQEILNPMFENIAYGANINGWEDIEWGEVAYAALLGGMMGGVFDGPGAIIDSYKKASSKHKAVKILKLGVEGSVISTAESLDIDTSSYAKEMSKLQEYADMLETGEIKNSEYKKQFNKVASEIVKLNNEITEAGGKVELPADTKKSGIAKLFGEGFFKKTNADTQEEQTGADAQTQNLSSENMARKGVSAQDGFVSQENVAQGVDVRSDAGTDVGAENVAVDGTVVPETESAVSTGARTNMSAFDSVIGTDTVTNEDMSYHRDDVHYKTEYFKVKKELASTKSKVSSAEFSKEFNRIYELGQSEDVSANSIESDVFTPAQVRRIYASGMVDYSVSHGYSDAIDFESAVKQLEEKAVVKQFTERLASKILDADVDTIKRVAKKLGVKVKFVDNLPSKNPSRYVESEKTIYIDKNTDKPMQQLFLHELTHFFETADGYLEFQDTVLESKAFEKWLQTPTTLKDNETYKDVDDFLHEIMKRYDFETSDEAKTEMVAFFVSENLFQKDFGGIGRLCNELTGTKRERFVAFIKNIFKRFKNAMSEMGKLERKFLKLYDTVGKNKNTTSKSDVKNMLVKTTDNKAVVVIDEDILAGKPENAWIKTVKSVLLSKFSKGIPISGRLIKVNKISREEFTNSKYSKYLRDTDGNVYVDKLKSANNLDEIVLASTNYINEDLKHARKDNFKEFARGDVLIRVGKNDYSAKVIVGFTGNNMVLYDVVDFTPAKFEIKKKPPHAVKHSKTTRNGETSTSIISDSSENVKGNTKNSDVKNLLLGNDSLGNDSEYLELARNPEKNRGKLQEMVNQAAYDSGLRYVGLHGTKAFGFTEFKRSKNYKGGAHFFTNKYRVADSYSGVKGATDISTNTTQGTYKTALDIKNPLIVDCNYRLWNDIPFDIKGSGENGKVITVDVTEYAEKHKHDGVIFKNVIDSGNLNFAEELEIKNTEEGKKKWASTVYAVFNSNQIKSLDPVTYDDDGNVIPLSERFNPKKKDIRNLLLGNEDALMDDGSYFDIDENDEVTRLSAQEYQRELKKNPKLAVFDKRQIELKAKAIAKMFKSKVSQKHVAEELLWIYNNIKNVDESGNTAKPRATALANEIFEYMVEESAQGDIFDELRAFFKDNPTVYDESLIEEFSSDWGEFIRKNGKRLSLKKAGQDSRGMGVDELYDSLHREFPGYFPENHEGPVSQLKKIAEVYEDQKSGMYETFNQDNKDQIVKDILGEIYRGYFDIDYIKKNSKVAKEQKNYKFDDEQFDEGGYINKKSWKRAQREEINRRSKQYVDEQAELFRKGTIGEAEFSRRLTAHYARVSLSAKIKPVESYEIAFRKYKERYDQVNTNTRKLLKELRNKLKNPTENNYIPEEIVDLVEAALEIGNKENFDLSHRLEQIKDAIKKRDVAPEVVDAYKDAVEQIEKKLREKSLGKAFAEICQRYDKYKFGETKDSKMGEFEQTFYCYHEAVAEKLHEVAEILEDADMVKLTLKQATALEEGLQCLTHFVNDSIYTIGMTEKAKVYEVASGSREEISNSGGFDKAIEKGFLPLLNPERFFKALGGFKHNSWCEKIGQMLNDGQTKALQIKQKLQEVLAPILENENFAKAQKVRKYSKDSLVDIGLTTADGESVSVPKGFAISLFKHLQNEANLNHALKGGFKIPKFRTYYKRGGNVAFDKGKGKRVYISDVGSTLVKLEKCFDDYDGQVIKSVTELFDTHTKNFYNQTTLDVFGFKKARVEKGYFPMITDSNFTQSDFASAFDATLKNQGNMKQRVQGAANPILLFDIFDVVNREIDRCGEYCGKLKAEITFHRIYNTVMPNFETSYKDEISEAGKKYIKNFMQDYSGTRDTENSHVLNKLRSNVATSALLLNANVVFKQLSSYPSAAGIVGFKPLLKAFATDGNGRVLFYKANTKLIDKYSAYHHIRREGFSTQETVDLRNNSFYDKRGLRFLFGWITAVDSAVTGRLWYSAEFYVKQNNPELEVGTDEFYKEVGKVYDRIILETQDNYTTMQRPDILRNPNAIIKSTVMFMTQPLQQLGSLYEASGNLAAQEKAFKAGEVDESVLKEARTKMVRTATGVLTSIAFCSLMAFCGAAAKGDLDDYLDEYGEFNAKGFFGGIGKDMVNNAMGMIPFGNTLFETINSIVTQEFRFGLSVANIDLINDTIDAFANLGQLFFNGDLTADEFKNKAVKLFEKTCSLLGIPTRNAKNLVGGFTNLFRTGDWFALSEKKSRKQYFAQMYDCVIKGDDKRYKELYNELLEKGYTVNEIEGGIKSVLKDAEAEDITEAAKALNDGDVNLYNEIIAEFVERGFDEKIVTETIESVANSLKPDELTEEEQKTKEKAKYDYMSDIIKNINFDGFTNAQKATAEQYAENVADEYGYQKATGKVKNEKFANAIRHDKAGTIPIEDYVLGLTVTDKKFADADGDGTVSPEEKVKAIDNSNLSTDIKTYLKAINIMGSTKVDTNADGRADTAFNKLSAEEQKEYIDDNKDDINSKLEDIQHSEEKSKAKEEYREQVSKKVDVMSYPEEMRSSVQTVIDSVAGAMAGEKVDGDWEAKTVNNFVDYDKSGFIDINTYVKYKVYTKGKTTQAEQFKAINELVGVSSEQKLYMKLWVAVKSKRFDDDGDGKKEKYFTKYSSSWQENYIRNNKNSIIANCDNWQ